MMKLKYTNRFWQINRICRKQHSLILLENPAPAQQVLFLKVYFNVSGLEARENSFEESSWKQTGHLQKRMH